MSTGQHDGSGPYLRVEVTLAMAIVKSDDTILNDDMLGATLAFGRGITGGDKVHEDHISTASTTQVLGKQLADLAQAVQVFIGQNFAFLEAVEDGMGMIDDVRETGETREVIGVASIQHVGGKGARA